MEQLKRGNVPELATKANYTSRRVGNKDTISASLLSTPIKSNTPNNMSKTN